MDEQIIKAILEEAVELLYEDQPNLWEFTAETGQSEWNLSHHLASVIHSFFPWFDCDVDVMKRESGDRRPDIILHKRGKHEFNFLVIEVKRDRSRSAIERDVKKIEEHWFGHQLRYKFGAVIHLKHDQTSEVTVMKNSSEETANAAAPRPDGGAVGILPINA